MIAWSVVQPVLLSLITDLAVDQIKSPGNVHVLLDTPEWRAAWKDRSVPLIHPLQKVALYLKVVSTVSLGWDDNRWEELDTGLAAGAPASGSTDVFQVVGGLRKVTLNLQAWVTEDTDALHAIAILDRLRTRLDFESSRARLIAADIDLTDQGQIRDMTASHEKRRFNVATMDLFLTLAVNSNDPIPTGFIERIILTSHEQLAPDTDVSDTLRTIDETLPPLP